jgi:hypothetical protein
MFHRISIILAYSVAILLLMMTGCADPRSSVFGNSRIDNARLPLIDKNLPAVVKTATFALG